MTRMVSFYVLIAIIVVLGVLFYRVMASFLLPLFLAALLVVIFHPVHTRIRTRCRGRDRLAAGIATAVIMLIVLAPAILIVTLAAIEGSAMVHKFDPPSVNETIVRFRTRLGLTIPSQGAFAKVEKTLEQMQEGSRVGAVGTDHQEFMGQLQQAFDQLVTAVAADGLETPDEHSASFRAALQKQVAEPSTSNYPYRMAVSDLMQQYRKFKEHALGGRLRCQLVELANPNQQEIEELSQQLGAMLLSRKWVKLGTDTVSYGGKLLVGMIIMVIATYFFLADGPSMIASVMHLSPLNDEYEEELILEFGRVSRAVVLATLLSAAAQGLLAGFGFWLAGFESVFLLILLTTLLALIPFVGAAACWIPASLWLYFYEERVLAAVLLALYGALIISMIDNIIKPMVLKGQSSMHPLLGLLSVLGGVQVLGPIGILIGPMVVAFLQTLLNILHRELTLLENSESIPPSLDSTGLADIPAQAATADEPPSKPPTKPDGDNDAAP